uniref:helix-turn-helix transcriptional regulator n=1 Tax=Nonomuraea pusilla TaxID=46177 RepID=UPI0006E1B56D|nr:helix-turn-helix transcriptional regulator [Nonomuraea pusilla]
MELPLGTAPAPRVLERIHRTTRTRIADNALLDELTRLLREIVPFDASFWAAADPLTMLATSPSRLENLGSGEACDRYWEAEFFVEDVNHFRALARRTSPAASLYRATGGHPARSSRYHTLNRPLGLGDELRCVFRTGGEVWGYACLWRAEGGRPFSVAEERVLADLSAPVAEAFRRAALLRPAPVGRVPDVPGLLTFDGAGVLESYNEAAEEWLRDLPLTRLNGDAPATPGLTLLNGDAPAAPHLTLLNGGGRDAPPPLLDLPAELRTVLNKARAVAAGRDTGPARARLLVRGRWLTIHGFPLRGPEAAAPRTALVIEPAKAADVAPLIARAYRLGRREQQVTRLVANGLTTSEIAATLCLSTHTVRGYLKQVFEKVEVSTRGGLVAKIFADHYKGTLDPDIHLDG